MGLGVGVADGVDVGVGLAVGDGLGVAVGVVVGVGVAVGVGVDGLVEKVTLTVFPAFPPALAGVINIVCLPSAGVIAALWKG